MNHAGAGEPPRLAETPGTQLAQLTGGLARTQLRSNLDQAQELAGSYTPDRRVGNRLAAR